MTLIERQQAGCSSSNGRSPPRTGIWLLITTLLFSIADWTLLWALPRLRLSFATGTEIVPPLVASLLVRMLLIWGLAAARLFAQVRWIARDVARDTARKSRSVQQQKSSSIPHNATLPLVLAFLALNLAFSLVQIDAYVLEPQWVQTTELTLSFDRLQLDAPPVRVVHLTDLHVERNSYREAKIIHKVNALQPDLILFTGDYLNLSRLHDPVSAAHWRQFVSQLEAPYGIYAVRGTLEPSLESMAWLVEETGVTWLEQETKSLDIRGQKVTLVGIACSHDLELDAARLDQALNSAPGAARDTFTLLLYHSPDLIREAAEHEIDLYLSGHTHGGQLRLPLLGPIVTGSVYGRQYVAGLFEMPPNAGGRGTQHSTWMYNSRGLGLEGSSMPRARFLCPPEIVSIDIQGR
ncbi:MAG: metallophosphoesterase [Anaerolineae bacterium]